MRNCKLLFVLVLLFAPSIRGQSPTDGRVDGSAYVNSYFHFSYSWPKFLQPYDTHTLALPQRSPYASEFLLFAAREGGEPFGIIVMAEKLNVPTAHSSGIRDGADFLDRAIKTFDAQGKPKILSRKHWRDAGGLQFDELDYMIYGEYSSGIAAQIGQFLIVFKCNAKSASDLAEMTDSAVALQLHH